MTMRIEPGVSEEDRSLRKSFRGFTPLGPYLVTADRGDRAGVGPVTVGDHVTIEIDEVGTMTLPVVAAEPAPRPF
ncbi:MAG TPA: hypothetical protein VHC18_12520 [Amycolatopsis sp.]|nr:hypothetical protein [Amycolatopsis sp.]